MIQGAFSAGFLDKVITNSLVYFKYLSFVEIKETASINFNTQRILKNHQRKATGEFVFSFYKGRIEISENIWAIVNICFK